MNRTISFVSRYFFAALSCLYLFIVGFIKSRNRALISKICAHFGYVQKSDKAIIPKIALSEAAPENLPIQITETTHADGNISLLELIIINRLIIKYKPHKIFEIGTFDGRTTINMAVNSSPDTKIYTLDLPKDKIHSTKLPIIPGDKVYINKETSGARYSIKDNAHKIIQLYGDSATFDFTPFYNTMDFIFVDGSHAYDYILNDSRQALKMLNHGHGVIIWHDYAEGWNGIIRALNKLYSAGEEFKNMRCITETSLVYLAVNSQTSY